ncbi:hypothetical protein [Zhouia amylolytica]|uniref:Uncharacterized protein n=1 Tax=Zhouia amylolytica AD3 TaxID=1286632 RepID=W2UPY5_9FLAO|nr:hypothetical protein [Zhouia amylolytica]ETN96235.1 hypothetical protein P278_07460 [Zhouia amylolytica AD3]
MRITVTYDNSTLNAICDADLSQSYILLDKNKIAIYHGYHAKRVVDKSLKTTANIHYELEESIINERFNPIKLSPKDQKNQGVTENYMLKLPYFSYPNLYFNLSKSQHLMNWSYRHLKLVYIIPGLIGIAIIILLLLTII